ncbi:hypothetical protein Tco_0738825 [Tanacetum coccineum]
MNDGLSKDTGNPARRSFESTDHTYIYSNTVNGPTEPKEHKEWRMVSLNPAEVNSFTTCSSQTTKTYYKHRDSRIMKAQELKTKTSAQTLIYKIFLQRYQVYQGRLLASLQDDAKYEHVGQDTRSQGGKDDQDGRIKI